MKNTENGHRRGWLAGILVVVLLALGAAAAVLLWPTNVRDSLTMEAGSTAVSANWFLKENNGEPAEFVSDITAVDLSVPGEYPLELRHQGRVHEVTLIVADTIAPKAVVQDVTRFAHEELKPEDFLVSVSDATEVTVQLKERPDTSVEGDKNVVVILTDAAGNTSEYETVLHLYVDTGAPVLSGVAPLYTYLGREPDYLANVTASDDREGELPILVDTSKVDLNTLGTYEILYSVTDEAGFTGTESATVTVTDDDTPPTILGALDISLYLGGTVSYRKGIQVTDDRDEAPKLEVDSSAVDLSKVGVYPLVYIGRDVTGNEIRREVTVTVAEKPASYMDEETIMAKADELLAKILKEGMTTEQQVRAIYRHVLYSYGYTNHSDKTDWVQGAWVMMHEGRGDCFNYFALTKLLLERCGIPNLDVRKVRNYENGSDHYWSLVSLDGGKTYYHLDTTPRMGDGDNFCLVTDAYLDAYSDTHGKSHNRDKSLYPATPEA